MKKGTSFFGISKKFTNELGNGIKISVCSCEMEVSSSPLSDFHQGNDGKGETITQSEFLKEKSVPSVKITMQGPQLNFRKHDHCTRIRQSS